MSRLEFCFCVRVCIIQKKKGHRNSLVILVERISWHGFLFWCLKDLNEMLRKLLPWVTWNRFANGQSFSPPSHEPEIWENLLSFTLVICFALLTSHLAHKEKIPVAKLHKHCVIPMNFNIGSNKTFFNISYWTDKM